MTTKMNDAPDIQAQLEQLNAQVSRLVENQRIVSESISELSPIVMSMMKAGAVQFQSLEDRGYFRFSNGAMQILDTVVGAFSAEELDGLGSNVVAMLDTLRNVTEPEVLAIANVATAALHTAGNAKPMGGMWSMYKATKDKDVQRGIAVMFEVLRQIGKGAKAAKGQTALPRRRALAGRLPDQRKVAPKASAVVKAPVASPMAGDDRFDANGFLADPSTWDRALGAELAKKMGVALTDDHWGVIEWVRADYLENDASPNVRRIATGSGKDTRAIYKLFPKAPGKTIAFIAGIPKPGGCL